MSTVTSAQLLREYASDDESRPDDDEKYSDGSFAAELRARAAQARAAAQDLDRYGHGAR